MPEKKVDNKSTEPSTKKSTSKVEKKSAFSNISQKFGKKNKVDKNSTVSSKKSTSKVGKKSVFSKIVKYFRECKGEVKKITWPPVRTVFKNMGIVLIVIIVMGLFIFGLDVGLSALLQQIMSV